MSRVKITKGKLLRAKIAKGKIAKGKITKGNCLGQKLSRVKIVERKKNIYYF